MLPRMTIGCVAVVLSWLLWSPTGAQLLEPFGANLDVLHSEANTCDDLDQAGASRAVAFRVAEGTVTSGEWHIVQTLAVTFGEAGDSQEPRTGQAYLIRWRAVGASNWRYADATQQPWEADQKDDWRTTEVEPGETYEVAVALVCSAAESTSPNRLQWSESKLATMFALSGSVMAHATHDSIRLEWPANKDADGWTVSLYESDSLHVDNSLYIDSIGRYEIARDAAPVITIEEVKPDRAYTLVVSKRGRPYDLITETVSARTEPVPADWWNVSVATGVYASAYGDRLFVAWQCIDEPLVSDFEVEINEYGAPQELAQTLVAACEADGLLAGPQEMGTAYEVVVRPVGMEAYGRAMVVTVPSMVRERDVELVRGIPDLPQWDVSVAYSREARGWAFTVAVERLEPSSPFAAPIEVEWINRGYRMSRVGRDSTFTYHSDSPDPIPFRIRWVNERGALSRWSTSRFVGSHIGPPYTIAYQHRDSKLYVVWSPARYAGARGSDRAYLHREGSPPQIVNAELSGRAGFDLVAGETKFVLHLGTYHGDSRHIDIDLARPPELNLYVTTSCQLDAGTPAVGYWRVDHGVPPYRVTVGDQVSVTSMLPLGRFESGCTVDEGERNEGGELVTQVSVEVEDGLGREMRELLSYKIFGVDNPKASAVSAISKPGPVGLELSEPNVGRDDVRLAVAWSSTDSQYWLHRFVIRWRSPGERDWNYESDDIGVTLTDHVAIRWFGLEPDTAYQYQVAVDIPGVFPEEIPERPWSTLREIRTLPVTILTDVQRRGTSVSVRWNRVPSATAYSVVLRSEDESWWKRHRAYDADVQVVVFEGIPVEADLDVEVITPPVGRSDWDDWLG